MSENKNNEKDKKVNEEEAKVETKNTVVDTKETKKSENTKQDVTETKELIMEVFTNPLKSIKRTINKNTTKHLIAALIILAVWVVAEAIGQCKLLNNYLWGYTQVIKTFLSIFTAIISPILAVLIMTLIVFIFNKDNKKSFLAISSAVILAKLPVVIASVLSILTVISSQISIITIPFAKFCSVISIVLMYFVIKSALNIEKDSEFLKKFVAIQGIYYVAYLILSLLKITI